MEEKEHVVSLLKEVKEAFRKNNVSKIKDISNETIHAASVSQDELSIAVAVIIYSLSKIIDRPNYRDYPGWAKFIKKFMHNLDKAQQSLERNNEVMFRKHLNAIETQINALTGIFKIHIKEVFAKARINKASRIYEHGVSMEKTARLLGISLFELAEYAGGTAIPDVNLSKTLSVEKRIQYVIDIFK